MNSFGADDLARREAEGEDADEGVGATGIFGTIAPAPAAAIPGHEPSTDSMTAMPAAKEASFQAAVASDKGNTDDLQQLLNATPALVQSPFGPVPDLRHPVGKESFSELLRSLSATEVLDMPLAPAQQPVAIPADEPAPSPSHACAGDPADTIRVADVAAVQMSTPPVPSANPGAPVFSSQRVESVDSAAAPSAPIPATETPQQIRSATQRFQIPEVKTAPVIPPPDIFHPPTAVTMVLPVPDAPPERQATGVTQLFQTPNTATIPVLPSEPATRLTPLQRVAPTEPVASTTRITLPVMEAARPQAPAVEPVAPVLSSNAAPTSQPTVAFQTLSPSPARPESSPEPSSVTQIFSTSGLRPAKEPSGVTQLFSTADLRPAPEPSSVTQLFSTADLRSTAGPPAVSASPARADATAEDSTAKVLGGGHSQPDNPGYGPPPPSTGGDLTQLLRTLDESGGRSSQARPTPVEGASASSITQPLPLREPRPKPPLTPSGIIPAPPREPSHESATPGAPGEFTRIVKMSELREMALRGPAQKPGVQPTGHDGGGGYQPPHTPAAPVISPMQIQPMQMSVEPVPYVAPQSTMAKYVPILLLIIIVLLVGVLLAVLLLMKH